MPADDVEIRITVSRKLWEEIRELVMTRKTDYKTIKSFAFGAIQHELLFQIRGYKTETDFVEEVVNRIWNKIKGEKL